MTTECLRTTTLSLLLCGLSLTAQAQQVTNRAALQAAILKRLLPLPADAEREIMNPYHAKPEWKLWAEDPSPVTIAKPHFEGTIAPAASADRRYPTFPDSWTRGMPPFEAQETPTVAGCWDDAYLSLDNYHTRLRFSDGQLIQAGKMRHGGDADTRFRLGVTFTSQSYSERGRHIIDDSFNNLNTERHFFFANCVRATPSHVSYRDNAPDKVEDLYDALFGHSYHSVGQSGSEVHALHKMALAGGCLPRKTKDLLKRHGAYAPALLTLFKAALPFSDAEGRDLPYEHELRHRPSYSSHGNVQHAHYCHANIAYHGYDNDRHIRRMVDMARHMDVAPPVAILNVTELSVEKDGEEVMDVTNVIRHIKSGGLTHVRIWGEPGETLVARVSLTNSYDLQNMELAFTGKAVYPNQGNVTVNEASPGVFEVRAVHDPKLPKGRIPVIFTARNKGEVPSNPVFLNFYWPGEQELSDYGTRRRGAPKETRRRLPVNVNLRPVVTCDFTGDTIRGRPGQTVSFTFDAKDPEGYSLAVYRRTGEVGVVKPNSFEWAVPADTPEGVHRVHLIFSDGTGGYTGREIKVLVSPAKDSLEDGWAISSLGDPASVGTVQQKGDRFLFANQPESTTARDISGLFTFRQVTNAFDMVLELQDGVSGVGLMIRNRLNDRSRQASLVRRAGKLEGRLKPGENNWGTASAATDSTGPLRLRLLSRGALVAGYSSTDGRIWTQRFGGKLDLQAPSFAGIACTGTPDDGPLECRWRKPAGIGPPVIAPEKQRPDRRTGTYKAPLRLTLSPPEDDVTLRYTVDGTEPTPSSPEYGDEPIALETVGTNHVNAAAFNGDTRVSSVRADYVLVAPEKK